MFTAKKLKLSVLFFFFAFWGAHSTLQGQLVITPAANNAAAVALVNNVLVSNTSTPVTNVIYTGGTGNNGGIGSFTINSGNPNLGFTSGIIMSTGPMVGAGFTPGNNTGCTAGLGGANNNQQISAGNGGAADAILSQVVIDNNDCAGSSATFDGVSLQFNFTPTTDFISFRYIFASEEYNEYVCTQFNDVFGFFITGPNPAFALGAPPYNNTNIALVPNTNTPVAINSINIGNIGGSVTCAPCAPRNQQYFIDNANCQYNFIYDGFTTVLEARAAVIPCSTYTLKLAIADVGDAAWDSAVLLEANSFNSGEPSASVTPGQYSNNVPGIGSATFESCANDVAFVIKRPGNTNPNQPWTTNYTLSGTATHGVDYNMSSPNITVPAGEDSVLIYVQAIYDGITEPNETVVFTFAGGGSCVQNQALQTTIINVDPMVVKTTTPPQTFCGPTSVNLTGTVSGGWPFASPPKKFAWLSKNVATGAGTFLSINSNTPNLTTTVTETSWLYVYAYDLFCDSLQAIDSVLITIIPYNAATPMSITMPPDTLCPGQSATISPVITNIQGAATYSWNPPQGNLPDITVSPSVTTIYTLTVSTPCETATQTVKISVGQPNISLVSKQDAGCGGVQNGSITVTGSGGFAPLKYSISSSTNPPQSSGTFNGLAAGTYILTVTDVNGCTNTLPVTITSPSTLTATETHTTIKCFGQTATITVTPAGVTGTANYKITPGPGPTTTNPVFTGLSGGTYTITVNDANNCPVNLSVVIPEPPQLTLALVSKTDVKCFGGNDGRFEVAASGGTAPYKYYGANPALPQQNVGLYLGLTKNTYNVTVEDANQCTATIQVVIDQPTPLALSTSKSNVTCNGGNNGLISLNPSGGTPPYTYTGSGLPTQTSPNNNYSGLTVGTYNITVTDQNGCTTTTSVVISQPTALNGSLVSTTPETCPGTGDGNIVVAANGGTPLTGGAYTFVLNPGNISQTNGTFTGLAANANYVVTVTDANQCTININAAVTSPPKVNLTVTHTDILCFGLSTGTITASATGGQIPFQYQIGNAPLTSNANFTGLAAGTYKIKVFDFNNCGDSATVTIAQPSVLTETHTTANISCNGGADGSFIITPAGGTPQYSYLLNNAPVPNVNLTGLSAGFYLVRITDANGCSITTSATIIEPSPVSVTVANVVNIKCFGGNDGAVTVTGAGGTPPYRYRLNNGAYQTSSTFGSLTAQTGDIGIIDDKGCTATVNFTVTQPTEVFLDSVQVVRPSCGAYSDGSVRIFVHGGTGNYTYQLGAQTQSSPFFPGLPAGTYLAVVTDQNQCSKNLQVVITEPSPVVITNLSATDQTCFNTADGTITFGATGGTAPYQYRIDQLPFSLNTTYSGLAFGKHYVYARDVNNCESKDSIIISRPPALTLAALRDTLICADQPVSFNAVITNSIGNVTYLWRNVTQNQDVGFNATVSLNPAETAVYEVTVTDQCYTLTRQATVTVIPPNLRFTNFSINTGNLVCKNTPVSASVSVTGGSGNYTYSWNNGPTISQSNYTISSPTNVYVSVSDGCMTIDTSLSIAIFPQPQLSANAPVSVCVFESATLSATGSSGNGTYVTYSWKTAQGSFVGTGDEIVVTPTSSTNYIVTVTDGCGNTATAATSVLVKPRPVVDAGPTKVICRGTATTLNGTATLNNNCSFRWYPALGLDNVESLTPTANPLITTTYTLTSTCEGCEGDSDTVTVFVKNRPTAAANPVSYGVCQQKPDSIQLNVTAGGGNGALSYQWSPATGLSSTTVLSPKAKPNQTQVYTLRVTDALGCESEPIEVIVNIYPTPAADAGADKAICQDGDGVTLDGAAIGNGVGYSYLWSPAVGLNDPTVKNPVAKPSVTTTYSLVVTSLPYGCVSNPDPVTVSVNAPATPNAGPDKTICFEDQIQIGAPAVAGVTYVWTPETGLSNPNVAQPLASPPHTMTYMVTAFSAGCPGVQDFVTINVRPKPTVATKIVGQICPGDTVELDATVSGAPGPYQYTWTPNANISNPNIKNPKVYPTQSGWYYLAVVADGCIGATVDSTFIEVFPMPNVDANTTALPELVICEGETVQLPASIVGNENYTFYWEPTYGLDNPAAVQPNANPVMSQTYTLFVTQGVCTVSDQVRVRVIPKLNLWVEKEDFRICLNDSVTLKAFSNSSTVTYNWSPANGLDATDKAFVKAQPQTTTTYTVEIVEEGKCKLSEIVTVAVLPIAHAQFTQTNPQNCNNTTVSFQDESTGAVSWVWDFGDGSPVSNDPNPQHTYAQPGNYQVRLTVYGPGGCADDTLSTANITLFGGSTADFISEPTEDSLMVLPEATVAFTDNSTGAVTWQWTFGDGSGSTEQNPTHTFDQAGTFKVTLTITDANRCVQTVERTYRVREPELFIPNVFTPNGDGQNDFWRPVYDGTFPLKMSVYDRWGVVYYEGKDNDLGWNGLLRNGSQAETGVYYYEVHVGARRYDGWVTLVR